MSQTPSNPPAKPPEARNRLLLAVLGIVAVAAAVALVVWLLRPPADGAKDGETYGFQKGSDKLQVGFITVGPASDWGFNYQHNQGRLAMEAVLRDKVKTALVENIPETAEVERVMQRMCDNGAGLIYSTSYGYADSVLKVAPKYPSVKFMQCLGTNRAENAGTYSLNVWEPAYVCGAVTAKTVKGKKLGFLGAHPVPPIYWTVNAFALGAQSVKPDITVDIVFTNSWNDPAKETEAVKSLADRGVEAVYILVDSPIAGVQAAERAGIYSCAHFADLSWAAPRKWLTGSIWNWGPLYVDVTKSVLDKTWTNKHVSGGFKEGYVALASFGPDVSGPTQSEAREMARKIGSGELQVFAGPLYDSAGKERVPAGKTMTIPDILSFEWVVRGVHGAPNK